GFNSGDAAEGSSFTNPCSSNTCTKSVERKARNTSIAATMQSGGIDEFLGNGYDTDNNANDFIVRDTKEPQNSSSPPEP
ncbi:MAG: lamin tail domain-containing protein, partial [Myxococcota bacterium]